MNKTKIICTIGPASEKRSVLRKMMLAGMSVGRLNFSHAQKDALLAAVKSFRFLNKKYKQKIKLLGDLQGHRIRIGNFSEEILLKKNQTLYLSQTPIKGTSQIIPFDYKGSLIPIKKGHSIFIDDGNIALEVTGRTKNNLKTKVVTGGLLRPYKGVNIPQAKLDFGRITSKDISDIDFCKKQGIDYLAQSFVCGKKDILEIKEILGKSSKIKVFAKIENREGIENIDQIIKVSDGIIVARGDMGVSLPIYKIPIIQKMIIKRCNQAKKPVVTATQMLESMTENLRPTRAEVTDVANAILDGTDFVMLSAETAAGKYPHQAVKITHDIINFTEASVLY